MPANPHADIQTLTYNGITYSSPVSVNLSGSVTNLNTSSGLVKYTNGATNISGINNNQTTNTYNLTGNSVYNVLVFVYFNLNTAFYAYSMTINQLYTFILDKNDQVSYNGTTNFIIGFHYTAATSGTVDITTVLVPGTTITANNGTLINYGGNIINNCLLKGSKVLTPSGYTNIEDINKGDIVLNPFNEKLIVNRLQYSISNDYRLRPYVIKKDSFDENIPNEDIYISRAHKVKYLEMMVKAKDLKYHLDKEHVYLSDMQPPYHYYHIEVEQNKDNNNIVVQNLEVETLEKNNSHIVNNEVNNS